MVHEERLVGLFYGQRALAIGALHPVNYTGTAQASAGRSAPFKRLARTAKDFEAIFFGTRAEADKVLGKVHRLHERVVGTLGEDAGPYPAETPYAAFDPALMLWTVAVTADSTQFFYELFVRRLSDAEREALWQDFIRFAELFGMPREVAPPDYNVFRAWWDEQLASDGMHLTDEARYMGAAVAFEIPMPAVNQGAKRLHDLIMLGSFPQRVRELYGWSFSTRQARAYAVAVAAVRGLRTVAPRKLTHGSNVRSFKLVADTERSRIANDRPTPQLPPLAHAAAAPVEASPLA
jgi:uncharacterized protein (DUF2236 family)